MMCWDQVPESHETPCVGAWALLTGPQELLKLRVCVGKKIKAVYIFTGRSYIE